MDLYRKWHHVLSDSRIELELFKQLYIVDSTVFSLFKDILKVAGRPRKDGRSKGGIKAHTLIQAVELMPCLVRFTAATTHDHTFLQHLNLPEGSYIVMDKGYVDYNQYQLWSNTGVHYITRMRDNALYQSIEELDIPDHVDEGVIKDEKVTVQYSVEGKKYDHLQRRIAYWDDKNQRLFIFVTNDMQIDAGTIALIYKYRWQIELLFKKLKQNFPVKYFLGDNVNAIEIQLWASMIAMLLLEVVKRQLKKKWAYSNMVALVRFHLMAYISLFDFLNDPEKTLIKNNQKLQPSLFPT